MGKNKVSKKYIIKKATKLAIIFNIICAVLTLIKTIKLFEKDIIVK